MERGKVLTGPRARFLINGQKVGYARTVTASEEYTNMELECLDNIEAEEIVTVGYRVTLSCSKIRIIGESLKKLGYFPQVGKTTAEHLRNVLLSGELAASLEAAMPDGSSMIIAEYEQVKIATQNWTIDARGIVGEDVTFNCIRARDETGG